MPSCLNLCQIKLIPDKTNIQLQFAFRSKMSTRLLECSVFTKTSCFFLQLKITLINYSRTSIIRTSIIRISRLSGLFLWSQFGYDYVLVTIKICSHILFKTTALKGAVKCKGFLLSKSRGSTRACRKVGLN